MTVQDIYSQVVKPLPAADRLRLANLILSDIALKPADISDRWDEQDFQDFSKSTWERSPNLNDDDQQNG